VSAAVTSAVAGAVVGHAQLDESVRVADEYLGALRVRVLERVREALLHEAVRGQVDSGRELHRVALDREHDREPGFAGVLDELVQVLEARLGRKRGSLLRASQHADHASHLRHGFASRLLDDEQRLAFAFLFGLEQAAHRRSLDGHDADAVADDVVELPCDACPLLGDSEAGSFLALALGHARSLLCLLGLARRAGKGEADEPRDSEDDRDPDPVPDAALGVVVVDDPRDSDCEDVSDDRLPALRQLRKQHVAGNPDEQGNERVGDELLVDERRSRDQNRGRRRRPEWEAPAEKERCGNGDRRNDVEPQRALRPVLRVDVVDGGRKSDADADDDQAVEPVAAGKRPRAARQAFHSNDGSRLHGRMPPPEGRSGHPPRG
jgi:hypothetical protein